MTRDTYKKAKDFMEDIEMLDRQLKEIETSHHWVTTSTPNWPSGPYSDRFQNDLTAWLKQIRDQYQKEFDELT